MQMKKKYGLTGTSWEIIKEEMRHILIGLARKRQTICYSDLAAQIQTSYIHYRAPAFMRILGEVVTEDIEDGHPNLAVLVVQKQSGRCGAGYFKQAAIEGYDVSDPEAFWQAEFKRVCDYWADLETG